MAWVYHDNLDMVKTEDLLIALHKTNCMYLTKLAQLYPILNLNKKWTGLASQQSPVVFKMTLQQELVIRRIFIKKWRIISWCWIKQDDYGRLESLHYPLAPSLFTCSLCLLLRLTFCDFPPSLSHASEIGTCRKWRIGNLFQRLPG